MMRVLLQSLSSRGLRRGLVVAGVVVLSGTWTAAAYANCAEFGARAQRRSPVRWTPADARQGEYRLVSVAFEEREADITGLWHLEILDGGVAVDSAFETFMADGNELMVDTTPPSLGNVCNGVWARTGSRTYKVKHPSFLFNADGTVSGTAIFRTELRLSRNGNSFTGQTTIDFYDVPGNFLFTLTFDLRATRITVN